jgi:glycosyltransferase involved in cell wall biosynthesis
LTLRSASLPTPDLTVVIPTRNRRELLRECLVWLERQDDSAGSFEVVVVDDGSEDGTGDWLQSVRSSRFSFTAVLLPPGGPASARNEGVKRSRASRILLLGDDTFPEPGALGPHAEALTEDVGIQGRVDWDERTEVTAIMRFLAPEGPQFYFRGLRDRSPVSYWAVTGANFSAPASWFREEPFDTTFPHAAFEDTELAYRWHRKGRRFRFSESSICRHHHRYDSIAPFLERQRRAGRLARYAVRKHPVFAWRALLQPALAGAVSMVRSALGRLSGPLDPERGWDLACRRAYLAGFFLPGRGGKKQADV